MTGYLRRACAESGRVMAFKELYGGTFLHRIFDPLGVTIGIEDSEHYPLDRQQLAEDVQQAAAIRESQSVATGDDAICYTPGYLLTHLPQTIRLLINSVIQTATIICAPWWAAVWATTPWIWPGSG